MCIWCIHHLCCAHISLHTFDIIRDDLLQKHRLLPMFRCNRLVEHLMPFIESRYVQYLTQLEFLQFLGLLGFYFVDLLLDFLFQLYHSQVFSPLFLFFFRFCLQLLLGELSLERRHVLWWQFYFGVLNQWVFLFRIRLGYLFLCGRFFLRLLHVLFINGLIKIN
eukprot:UN27793